MYRYLYEGLLSMNFTSKLFVSDEDWSIVLPVKHRDAIGSIWI